MEEERHNNEIKEPNNLKSKDVRKKKEPKDYGISKTQFHAILDKASHPIKKFESDSKSV